MDILSGSLIAALLGLAAAGSGLAILELLRLRPVLSRRELWPVATTVGVGALGWLMFFPAVGGLLERPVLWMIVGIGLAGWIVTLRASTQVPSPAGESGRDYLSHLLLAILGVILIFNLTAALAPPADADTAAYHFALPKHYLAVGRVEFIPRAIDGAPPLLLHMSYTLALGLGGEKALTLWSCLLGLLPAWLLYAMSRRFLSKRWSLTLTILFITTPAVIYSGNAGHIEVKIAAFVIVCAIYTADCLRTGEGRYAVLAGLAAGCFLAAKYNGLILVGAAGLVILWQPAWLRSALLYSVSVAAVAWQWYAWNYANSGDPLFPLLYDWLGAKDGLWSPAMSAYFKAANFSAEAPAPRDLLWLLAYPFVATFNALPYWEAGRTGLGPFAILTLPFALAGLGWRRPAGRHPLLIIGAIAAIFYVAWFLSGTSQRIRHLVPLYPLAVLCLGAAAAQFTQTAPRLTGALTAGIACTIVLQIGGHALFASNYLRHLINNESRGQFLERNVARYAAVPWINSHLSQNDRLLLTERQLVYHIDVPVYTAQPTFQHLVNLIPGASDPRRFLDELSRLGITHILLMPSLDDAARGVRHIWTDELVSYTDALVKVGCARKLHTTNTKAFESRALPGLAANMVSADVIAVDRGSCRL